MKASSAASMCVLGALDSRWFPGEPTRVRATAAFAGMPADLELDRTTVGFDEDRRAVGGQDVMTPAGNGDAGG